MTSQTGRRRPTRLDARARPRVGIVGAGRVGTTLGAAMHRAGWPVVAVASRDPGRRARFQALVPGAVATADARELPALADLLWLTVPDDDIGPLAASLRTATGHLRAGPGRGLVHTSGALPASVLDPDRSTGAALGSFHPLVPFADIGRAIGALAGASVAVEGDPQLAALLARLAGDLGAMPIAVPAAGKAAYHAAAVLAAGGLVALLDVIAELGHVAGMDEATAMRTYLPLVRQGITNASDLGIAAALTGPVVRGDRDTVALHLEAIEGRAPDALGGVPVPGPAPAGDRAVERRPGCRARAGRTRPPRRPAHPPGGWIGGRSGVRGGPDPDVAGPPAR